MDTNGVSYADVAAMVGRGDGMNGWMNNPFMYLIWLAYLGGGGFGFGNRAGEAVQTASLAGQIDGLRGQMADNHNADITNAAIGGVGSAVSHANIGNLLGQKDMQAAMASCCCDIKSNILGQTNALQSQIAGVQNALMNGFAQVGFLTQQQTNELNTNANANTQRILDKMCASETQALRDKLLEASQSAQTATIIAAIPKA